MLIIWHSSNSFSNSFSSFSSMYICICIVMMMMLLLLLLCCLLLYVNRNILQDSLLINYSFLYFFFFILFVNIFFPWGKHFYSERLAGCVLLIQVLFVSFWLTALLICVNRWDWSVFVVVVDATQQIYMVMQLSSYKSLNTQLRTLFV